MSIKSAAVIFVCITTPVICFGMRATRIRRVSHSHVSLPHAQYRCNSQRPVPIPFIPQKGIQVIIPEIEARSTRAYIEQMTHEEKERLQTINDMMFDNVCRGIANSMSLERFEKYESIEKSLVVNQVNLSKRSLLIQAAQISHLNFMGFLLELRAFAGIIDADSTTALNANPRKLTPYLVGRLLENGAPVNAPDEDGNTALHQLSIKHNPRSMVEWSPVGENLELCQSYHRKSVEYLLAYGANMDFKNKEGQTPYDLAQQTKNTKIVRLFDAHRALQNKPVS